ncbi:GNAT family N-acetyltransferase [Microseira wollei]|uniref:GCN5-related N-acetyltransferase n=1 Tax=Microseira wollei NIES-4236 TaxID=2530354 RepID=A0AAV3X1B4_9CYAN|nr:GNAT family N-acetyltransferase [Microseira wollei]GET35585.1 GCN5-related N-acetyltransferase [Microseira wollei NIES-4236]
MKLHRFEDASQFYQQVKDYLLNYEAHHCLLFGIIDTLINYPQRYDKNPYLASVEDGGKVVAVAVKTAPYAAVLSKVEDFAALEAIASDLHAQKEPLPGVNALTDEALAFAQTWQKLTGESYEIEMQMRIHQLQTVEPIAKSSGYLRLALESDRQLLLEWYKAFELDALGENEKNSARNIEYHLKHNLAYIWEDKIPVSMVFSGGSTPNGKRITAVYTPPEYRQKGYATSCVAALSQNLLDSGCKYCFLYTDLANPTSNHIYHKIGYRPVSNWSNYSFIKH